MGAEKGPSWRRKQLVPEPAPLEPMYTTRELMNLFGVTRQTIRMWARTGLFGNYQVYYIGRPGHSPLRFTKAAVDYRLRLMEGGLVPQDEDE